MLRVVPLLLNELQSTCHGFVRALATRLITALLSHNGYTIMACTAARACASKACTTTKYSQLNGCMCIHAGSYQDTFKQAVKDALYKGLLCPHTNAPPTLTRNPHCTLQRKGQVRFATSSDDEQLHIRIQPSLQLLLKNKSLPSLTSGSRPRRHLQILSIAFTSAILN